MSLQYGEAKTEVIDGKEIMMSPPAFSNHNYVKANIYNIFKNYLKDWASSFQASIGFPYMQKALTLYILMILFYFRMTKIIKQLSPRPSYRYPPHMPHRTAGTPFDGMGSR